MLEEERHFYDERLPDLLATHPGQFVLIKGPQLIGTYNSQEEALAEGGRRFGLSSFLVRQVLQDQPEVKIPALTLGVLSANTARTNDRSGPRP